MTGHADPRVMDPLGYNAAVGERTHEVVRIYEGSDGDATKALYARLMERGAAGHVAMNLFRAHKNSARAKVYRGGIRGQGSYRRMAYDRKQWAMDNLCAILTDHATNCGITWGWQQDGTREAHSWVLYVEIPTGQVSFHTAARGKGPDYAGKWDGVLNHGATRICRWVGKLLA